MDELPAPDLRDHRGRLHRMLLALAVGFGAASLAWWLTFTVAGAGYDFEHGNHGAGRFIFMSAGLALFCGYQLTYKILDRRAARAWKAAQFPQARIR